MERARLTTRPVSHRIVEVELEIFASVPMVTIIIDGKRVASLTPTEASRLETWLGGYLQELPPWAKP